MNWRFDNHILKDSDYVNFCNAITDSVLNTRKHSKTLQILKQNKFAELPEEISDTSLLVLMLYAHGHP